MAMKSIVKSVISGDTLVLFASAATQGQPPKERVLHLADVTAPRMGGASDDEPWAYESRDFLRAFSVGKPVSFRSTHSFPQNDNSIRDIGTAEIGGVDVAEEMLKNGWVKLKELKREPTEEDLRRRELETEAKAAKIGLWSPHGPQARIVHHTMPADLAAFVSEWKGKSLDALVEAVRNGSTLRVRLFMLGGHHQMVNINLAGVRCPKTASKASEPSEPWAEEAKHFTEFRLLQRPVRIVILSLPTSITPFQTGVSNAPPPSASFFIATVLHPAGNVAEHLVANGLARVMDWHAGLLASGSGMERLRAAEKTAKEKKLCLYANSPSAVPPINGTVACHGVSKTFEGTVVRIWSGDQISVVEKDSGKERRLQFSSVRGPKASDPKQAFYAREAREFLRKKLIGKQVRVCVDFIRPRDGEFQERECATVTYTGKNVNIAEQLIEKGLASVVRHRAEDEERSPDYDKLMAVGQTAATEKCGIHSGKDEQLRPTVNISQTVSFATACLHSFKRQGRVAAVVEYVASGSRFRLFLPKDNQTLILVLSGIKTPRVARSSSEQGEAFGTEAAEFSARRYTQRDVEFEVESVDKFGGFIGTLWLRDENAAVALVREGYATVHSSSADALSWSRQLFDAEAEARQARRNLWQDYDEEAEKAAQAPPTEQGAVPTKVEYIDVIISDVRTKNGLSISVQILNTEGIAGLEKLMHDFSLYHKSAKIPADFTPTNGELVSAKFSDGSWYRARIRRSSPIKKEAEVTFIDYGNQSTLEFGDLRPLDSEFRSLPGQAQEARLRMPKVESEYYPEAIDRFRSLCEGRKLVAAIDYREVNLLHLRLIEPTDPNATNDSFACINLDLLREGLAVIDRKGCKYISAYPQFEGKLVEALGCAKRDRFGMFEFGDIEEDE